MSIAPQNLPKRTRVLVKDILFQEKYRLSHTQVDLMAYIFNALSWATQIGSFLAITNKKFHNDLPQISEKMLEEGLRALKSMELIEVKMITVPAWKNAYVRGIKILPKGLEYNGSFYKPKEQEIMDNLKEQMFAQSQEIEALKEKLNNIDSIERPQTIQEEKEAQIIEESKKEESQSDYSDLTFTELVNTVTKEFGATYEPICNCVKGWHPETKFYINSYNKLTVLSPATGQIVQLKNPIEINDFWKHLNANRHKIGKVIDFKKELTLEEINNRYAKMSIVIQKQIFKVDKIEKAENGVQVLLKNNKNKNIITLSKKGETMILTLHDCEKVLLGLRE